MLLVILLKVAVLFFIASLDISKAFDSANHVKLYHS